MPQRNKKISKAIILPSPGLGDALLMTIAQEAFHKASWDVSLVHPQFGELSSWFPNAHFLAAVSYQELLEADLLFVQHDDKRRWDKLLRERREAGRSDTVFYPSHTPGKHNPLSPNDFVCDRSRPMTENVAHAAAGLLGTIPSKECGIVAHVHLQRRRFPKRILLHVSTSARWRCWRKQGFIHLAERLQREGFDVVLTLAPHEEAEWQFAREAGFQLVSFPSLDGLASFIYESGGLVGNESFAVHLASALGLKTVVIGRRASELLLWGPGWERSLCLTPPRHFPNWKGTRLRERLWAHLIRSRRAAACCKDLFGPVESVL